MSVKNWLLQRTVTGSTYLQVLIISVILAGIVIYIGYQLFLTEKAMKKKIQKMFDEVQEKRNRGDNNER